MRRWWCLMVGISKEGAKMKRFLKNLFLALFCAGLLGPVVRAAHLNADMKEGNPGLKSAGPITFGPEGILFIADTKAAAVIAVDTGDTKPSAESKVSKVENISQKI